MIVKELGNLIQLMVCQRLDILPQLLQSELRLRSAVRMVKDIHRLPDNIAEAVTNPKSSLSSAAIACFSSAYKLLGFLRRLQRKVHNFLANAMHAHPAGLHRLP